MSHASVIVAIPADRANDVESAVEWEMMPFDENGQWFRDGSRWDWYVVGGRYSGKFHGQDIMRVELIDTARLMDDKRQRLIETYQKAAADTKQHRMFIYDVDPDETALDEFLAANLDGVAFPASYAFLQNRYWHEAERLGWFGTSALTECEIKAKEQGVTDVETMIRRCKHKDPETGASVICWNETWEVWNKEFYHRFIEPLHPDTVLVNVDYHV